jgi:butyryl-CoA dehydrogenase
MQGGAGLELLVSKIGATVARAQANPALAEHAGALTAALQHLVDATKSAWSGGNADDALANATPYLQAFGHTVLAWIWLDVALCAQPKLGRDSVDADALLHGKLAACTYFHRYELPRTAAWLRVVETRDPTCRAMDEAWF